MQVGTAGRHVLRRDGVDDDVVVAVVERHFGQEELDLGRIKDLLAVQEDERRPRRDQLHHCKE